MYEKFSFKRDGNKFTLELTGEAPTYTSLAYQADILRKKGKELMGFSIDNVTLTKFGTVTFTIKADFVHEYPSYLKTEEVKTENADFSTVNAAIPTSTAVMRIATTSVMTTPPSQFMEFRATTTATTTLTEDAPLSEMEVSERAPEPVVIPEPVPATRLFWLWSWFKFW